MGFIKKKSSQDSMWKEILEQYFAQFLEFFFDDVYKDIDFVKGYQFLDKEFQKIVKDNEIGKRLADKLVKVYLKDGTEKWLLIHIEIQGKAEQNFEERIYIYNYRIFDKYHREVISLVILTDDNENFRPERYEIKRWGFWHFMEFPVVKLLDYRDKIEELEKNENPFAIVVITHLKMLEARHDDYSMFLLKLSIAKKLLSKKYTADDALNLLRFIDWIISLPKELEIKFNEELTKIKEGDNMAYVASFEKKSYEKGKREGLRHGIEKSKIEIVKNLLKERVDIETIARCSGLSVEEIKKIEKT